MKVAMKVSGVKGNTVALPVGTIPAQHLEVGGSPVVLDVSGNFVGQVERWTLITNSPISWLFHPHTPQQPVQSNPDRIPPQV